jgi:hypothetical protein
VGPCAEADREQMRRRKPPLIGLSHNRVGAPVATADSRAAQTQVKSNRKQPLRQMWCRSETGAVRPRSARPPVRVVRGPILRRTGIGDVIFGNDRGRDFRGDRDRGRFFQFRGRDYAAMRAPALSYLRG